MSLAAIHLSHMLIIIYPELLATLFIMSALDYSNYLLLSSCREAIKQVWSNLFHRGIRRPEGSVLTYNYLPEHTCDADGILVMIHTRVQPCLKLKGEKNITSSVYDCTVEDVEYSLLLFRNRFSFVAYISIIMFFHHRTT